MPNVLALRNPTIQSNAWGKKEIMKFVFKNKTAGYKFIEKSELHITIS